MKTMQWYFDKYGESHQNHTNKTIHWICVPLIVFSLAGLLYAIPFPFPVEKNVLYNWATPVFIISLLFYITKSLSIFIGMFGYSSIVLFGNQALYNIVGQSGGILALISLGIFATAWVFQFIGHNIEGKKPSFIDDMKFLLIGPAWLLHFIYKKLNIPY